MKRKFLFTALMGILSLFSFNIFSQENIADESNEVNSIYVLDTAEILTDQEVFDLNNKAQSLTESNDFGFYIVTVKDMESFGYSDIESFSEYVYDSAKFGVGSEKAGILLVLSMSERDYDIVAKSTRGHYSFTDYGKDRLAKQSFIPYFVNDDWYAGFSAFLTVSNEYLQTADSSAPIDVTYSGSHSDGEEGMSTLQSLGIGFLAGLIIALIVCIVMSASMKPVKLAKSAHEYVDNSKVEMNVRYDHFSHRNVSRRKIENNSSSGHGGTTISGGGFSHSSGKF